MNRKVEYGLLAKDMALAKFAKPEALKARREKIAARMGLMHGLPQKIGQILGFREEDEQGLNAFAPLAEGSADLTAGEFEDLLKSRLGAEKAARISWIRNEGISASLGQTHEARLNNGQRVAVKQQYPNIGDCVKQDLKSFGWLLKPVGALGKAFDVQALKYEIGEMIDAELDYELEASWLRRFDQWLSEDRIVTTPVPVEGMCNGEVLTMSWVEGGNHWEVSKWPLNSRRAVCERLLTFLLRSTCVWGSVHADPHPGNFRFYRKGLNVQVGLVDFGSVKSLSGRFSVGYRKLLKAAMNSELDEAIIWDRFVDLGFNMELLEPLRAKLKPLTDLMLAPFLTKGRFDLSDWDLANELKEVLGKDRMQFRAAAPADLVFWIRAFHGMVRYLQSFDAPISWTEVTRKVLAETPSFDAKTCQDCASSEALIDDPLAARVNLKIEVTRNGKSVVSLALPGRTLRQLEELIPEEAKSSLKKAGVSVMQIKHRAIAGGYQAGELFCCEESVKQIRVWLEEKESADRTM